MSTRIATFFVAALSALVLGVGGVSASSAPQTWSFDVSLDSAATAANGGAPTWTGTASGPGSGTIAVKLLAAELRGQALHIELEVAFRCLQRGDDTGSHERRRLERLARRRTGAPGGGAIRPRQPGAAHRHATPDDRQRRVAAGGNAPAHAWRLTIE